MEKEKEPEGCAASVLSSMVCDEKGARVADFSFALRTSMNAIHGMASIAKARIDQRTDDAECVENVAWCVESVLEESKKLISILDSMLEELHGQKLHVGLENVVPTRKGVVRISGRALISKLSFLVVEDNPVNAEVIVQMIELYGGRVKAVSNGAKAVAAFADSPTGTYDCILMDVQMPEMNGYEATRAIRSLAREEAKKIPIVVMSAYAFDEDIQRARECGMTAHLAKPVRFRDFEAKIAELFSPVRS